MHCQIKRNIKLTSGKSVFQNMRVSLMWNRVERRPESGRFRLIPIFGVEIEEKTRSIRTKFPVSSAYTLSSSCIPSSLEKASALSSLLSSQAAAKVPDIPDTDHP